MIGHFPTPYPDELLYSVCARFSSRVAYANRKSTLVELFGASTASATVILPNRLGHLAETLPHGTSLTVDRLINQFTLLPFFAAFLPLERVRQIREDLTTSSGGAAYMRSGVMGSSIPASADLRFCSRCMHEDAEYFGEPYWCRLHQTTGVEVCLSHQVFLENSSAGLRTGRRVLQFISAEQATRRMPARPVDTKNQDHRVLLQLARDARWLLEHPSPGTNLKWLHSRYLRLLIERGLATYTGSIHVKKLLDEFSSHYSSTLLTVLHCEVSGNDIEKTNWLLRLVRHPKHTQHPLYHLLLIQFLGCTPEEFFQSPEELNLFGESPWPCLNPAADHYRQSVIMKCQLGDRQRYGKPTGRFSCECGFAYTRTGPESSNEGRFRIGRMISFGQVWEDKLKMLWKNSSLGLSEMGRKLGVDPLTIRRHATRLGLSFSRSGKESKPLTRSTQLKGKTVSAAWERKRRSCRSTWLSAIKQRQKVTLKTLRGKLPREYAWLMKYDSVWLDWHKPRPQRRKQSTTSVDWKRRDTEYALAVKTAAAGIKEAHGRPIQVTKTAIGRAIGAITLLQQKLNKMPLTAQVLANVIETREQYAVRRVWWAAELYCKEFTLPREWQLVMRANVYSVRDNSAVKYAIQSAINMLTSKLLQGGTRRAVSWRLNFRNSL